MPLTPFAGESGLIVFVKLSLLRKKKLLSLGISPQAPASYLTIS